MFACDGRRQVEHERARAHMAGGAVLSVSARRCFITERRALERHVAHGAVFRGPFAPHPEAP
eukprot:2152414-Pyramimonas_sp.AAC.1